MRAAKCFKYKFNIITLSTLWGVRFWHCPKLLMCYLFQCSSIQTLKNLAKIWLKVTSNLFTTSILESSTIVLFRGVLDKTMNDVDFLDYYIDLKLVALPHYRLISFKSTCALCMYKYVPVGQPHYICTIHITSIFF